MKRILIIILSGILLSSCFLMKKGYSKTFDGANSTKLYTSKSGEVNMTGVVNEQNFSDKPFSTWYKKGYNAYKTEAVDQKDLKKLLSGVTIEVYFGTWCEDSRREIPRFMRIVNDLGLDKTKIKLVAVNEDKTAFWGEEIGKDIKRVPTFIFYKKDATFDKYPSEIGRIVEAPIESLERDMIKILKKEDYVPNYSK